MYSNISSSGDLVGHPAQSDVLSHQSVAPCGIQPPAPDRQHTLELAWCAGLFDGDGCVIISKQLQPGRKNLSYRLTLSVVQNCYSTIDHFRSILGLPHCLVEIRRTVQHNRQIYDLRFDGLHAVAALRLLQPCLIRKAIEAQVALEFWTAGSMGVLPGRNGLPTDVWATREKYFRKMKKLK